MDYVVWLAGQLFRWDRAKAVANATKHGVTFEEATTVFLDVEAKLIDDPDHSMEESRVLALGVSERGRMLVVSFVERGKSLRLISARPANVSERRRYVG